MSGAVWVALGVAGGCAVVDWTAVLLGSKPLEYVAKPATIIALMGVTVLLEPADPTQRTLFVVALGACLVGDIALMLPRDAFLAGLAAFLVGHAAYIAGLARDTASAGALIVAVGAVGVLAAPFAWRILTTVRREHPAFLVPVSVYASVITMMVATALAGFDGLAAAGAVSFYASDTLIAWHRFVRDLRWAPVAIMVTYHSGQAGLVLSLAL